MSQINANAVDALYPIAGQDNDSQGFRNNFAAIKDALAIAKSEIGDLQNNAVLKGVLGAETTTALENDLDSSLIKDGVHKQFYPVFADRGTALTTTTVNLDNGPVQKFTLTGTSAEFKISWGSWPTSTPWPSSAPRRVSSVRIMLKAATDPVTVSFIGTVDIGSGNTSGHVWKDTNLTFPYTVTSSNYEVFDVWTTDEGDNIFINKVGSFEELF